MKIKFARFYFFSQALAEKIKKSNLDFHYHHIQYEFDLHYQTKWSSSSLCHQIVDLLAFQSTWQLYSQIASFPQLHNWSKDYPSPVPVNSAIHRGYTCRNRKSYGIFIRRNHVQDGIISIILLLNFTRPILRNTIHQRKSCGL